MSENYFQTLNSINVNDKTESKNGLTYLSWAWAWGELKKLFPDSFYTIYENKDGLFYHTDGKTAWVKTGVTVVFNLIHTAETGPVHHEIEHIEYLPVMDFKNRSIPLEQVTSFDVNKAIQRSLTKAVARHGLGLYIYAGEDLPEDEKPKEEPVIYCADCGRPIRDGKKKNGSVWRASDIAKYTHAFAGRDLCEECGKVEKAKQDERPIR